MRILFQPVIVNSNAVGAWLRPTISVCSVDLEALYQKLGKRGTLLFCGYHDDRVINLKAIYVEFHDQ